MKNILSILISMVLLLQGITQVGAAHTISLFEGDTQQSDKALKSAKRDENEMLDMAKAALINQRLENAIVLMLNKPKAYVCNEVTIIDSENLNVVPKEEGGRTLVPVRFIAESFDAIVLWNDATKTVTISKDRDIIQMVLGSNIITINGQQKEMLVSARIENGRTLIPLRDMAEALGKKVFWDDRGLIIISDEENIFDPETEKESIDALVDRANEVKDTLLTREWTIVYLGGSITQGGGASVSAKGYVSQVHSGLRKLLAGQKVNSVNAGIGGTNSGLGIFRLEKDVVSKNPDMVFVEFAVNDITMEKEYARAAMEGIVTELLKLEKVPAVFFVYTTNSTREAIADVHRQVADYYGIPDADLQEHIWSLVKGGEFGISDVLPDSVHPNDKGHKLYADFILKTIKDNIKEGIVAPVKKDSLLTGYEFRNPRLIPVTEAKATGSWKTVNVGGSNSIKDALVSNTPNDTLELTFKGKAIGLYHMACKDGGIMEISIDSEPFVKVDTYKTANVPYSLYQRFDLEDKEHKIVVKVSESKNSAATDSNVKIGYFLVEN